MTTQPSGTAAATRYEEVTIRAAGAPVVLSIWHGEAGRPVTVFLPGTMTHPLFYEQFCSELASLGSTVVGVHFEGHGKSPRQRRILRLEYLVDDVSEAVAWAADRFGCRPVLLGSSQGGILAMAAVARGVPVAGVVAHNVLDPALPDSLLVSRLPRWLVRFHRPLRAALRVAARVAPRLPVPFQLYLDIDRVCREPWTKDQFLSDPLGLRSYPLAFMADLFTVDLRGMGDGSIRCPVIVVAGSGDPLFSLEYSRAVFERIVAPGKQLRVVETDHHLLFNECIDQVLGPVAADIDALAGDERRASLRNESSA